MIAGTLREKYPSKRAFAQPELAKQLKELGVYDKFKENCKKLSFWRWNSTVSEAFAWDRSPEGFDFWYKIDKKT